MIPKYRAWDSWRKRMSVVDRIYIDTKGVRLYDDFGEYWRDFRDVELMQSTGLKDKNGKEIFEGDILKFNDEWNEYCHEGYVDGSVEGVNYVGFEIIGNVFENRELLEDE